MVSSITASHSLLGIPSNSFSSWQHMSRYFIAPSDSDVELLTSYTRYMVVLEDQNRQRDSWNWPGARKRFPKPLLSRLVASSFRLTCYTSAGISRESIMHLPLIVVALIGVMLAQDALASQT